MLQERHFEFVIQGYTKLLGPDHPTAIDASYRLRFCEDASSCTSHVDGNDGDGDGSSHGGGGE